MIRLAKPHIPRSALMHVEKILASGNLVQGKYVEKFESALGDYLDSRHAVVVSSGTAALHLALLALGIGSGDEVIVPAFTFPATANVVELTGARPVLVDIALEDFCIDPAKTEAAVTPHTRAIIPVHEFGQAADMSRMMDIAQRHGLLVIEDAACALGTEYEGKKAGTFTAVGCFSFHPRKAITTGEGGLVVTADDGLARKLRALRNHGITIRDGAYDFLYAGANYRMTEVQAALGLAQIGGLEEMLARRNEIAAIYDSRLASLPGVRTPPRLHGRRAAYQTYHLLLEDAVDRDALIASLRQDGIETNYGAHALNCVAFYRGKYGLTEEDCPQAARAFKKGLALPIGMHLRDGDVARVVSALEARLTQSALGGKI